MLERVGPLIIDIEGESLTEEDKELLKHPAVGGVIFFTRNYSSKKQMSNLCKDIRAQRSTPLLLCVDQEGGRVQRFKNDFTVLPSMGAIGAIYEDDADKAIKIAQACGWVMAAELLSVGIDLSFAPVLDLNKTNNPVIGNRAFHENEKKVSILAAALMMGMKEVGMASVGKHFPGHGSVEIDSHVNLPVDNRSLAEVMNRDLRPFIEAIQNKISAIMAGHILFPKIDPKPVGFSQYWLDKQLKNTLGFEGVIFSDDLNMQGAASEGDYSQRVLTALTAGCDMVLLCNNRVAVKNVLKALPADTPFIPLQKFLTIQGQFNLYESAMASPHWMLAQELIQQTHDTITKRTECKP